MESRYHFTGYILILALATVMTWLGGYDAGDPEPLYYYEHAVVGYIALTTASFIAFTRRVDMKLWNSPSQMKMSLEGIKPAAWVLPFNSFLEASFLALVTLPFLALIRIITLLEWREISLILLLFVVSLTTYRVVALHLARMMKEHPLLLQVVQLSLFAVILLLSLGFYPPISPINALHSVTALSTLRMDEAGFYHPLTQYIITLLIHGLILGGAVSMDMILRKRIKPGNAT